MALLTLADFAGSRSATLWLTKSWTSGFTASHRYLSSVFTSNRNTIRLGGWTVFSGAISYRRSFYDWSVNAENLFNRQRYFVAQINGNQVYPGSPINVFTTLRLSIPIMSKTSIQLASTPSSAIAGWA